MPIKGLHAMFHTPEADAARLFIRDKLGFDDVTDVGGGWLIFGVSDAEIGCHPSEKPFHDISFYCEDIEATVAELNAKGVETSPIEDRGFGIVTELTIPGGVSVSLYQPKYERK